MFKVLQPHPMVCALEKEIQLNEKIDFLLISDLHFDHPKCQRELLKEHIEECIARDGYIMMNGDIFCIMQGKFDKRSNKAAIRPEDMTDTYFDSVVENAVEFFLPYAHRILFIGLGNHETSIIKRTETNLLKRFCDLIYYKTGHRIALGQYHGWIYIKGLYLLSSNSSRRSVSTLSYKIYHNHGTGGDAAVTGGSIEDHRKMTQVEGADAIWMGHNHNKYAKQIAVHYLDTNPQAMNAKMKIVENIRTGTYKQEFNGSGFHIETGKAPKPLGGVWLTLTAIKKNNRMFLAPSVTPTWHGELIL